MSTVAADSGDAGLAKADQDVAAGYNEAVVRLFTLAAMFWGIAAFLVGVVIALQLAYPALNFNEWTTFGRLRPLHTSAAVFAFGGNVLIGTSFYPRTRPVPVLGLSGFHRSGRDQLPSGR
jgi:cytochrome c oxidase cbb3-type subunit 1